MSDEAFDIPGLMESVNAVPDSTGDALGYSPDPNYQSPVQQYLAPEASYPTGTSWTDAMMSGADEFFTDFGTTAPESTEPSTLGAIGKWGMDKLKEVSGNEWAKLIGTAMSGFAASKFKQKELDLKERAQSLSEEKVRRAATSSEKLKVPGLIGAFKAKA